MQQISEAAAMQTYMDPVMRREPSDPILRQVPVPYLRAIWPEVAEMLASVVQRSDGRWTIDDMARRFVDAEWQMWVVFDGTCKAVLGTEVFEEASGQRSARVVFLTGLGAAEWVGLVSELEDWARDQGCRKLEMIARKGWARHLTENARRRGVKDFKLTHVLLEKDL